jgi:hypothetical protein
MIIGVLHKYEKQRIRSDLFFPNSPWGANTSDNIEHGEVEIGSQQPCSGLAADPSSDP